ncbi:hypothetical protein [Nocardia australiensis]|uniref:hypothetical protein n=1 Tax=Nocardia australiensis TaxID=2887191 RepID=UPI001D132EA0|nr:hypothetical protein [Nocardia australiensis]
MPHFRSITRDGLVEIVVHRIRELGGRLVIAVDGADAAEPVALADDIASALRATGRPAEVVSLHDYIRPASLRMEFGRDDELSYRTAWFDYAAVRREVVDTLRERGRWLPALWNESTDRSARATVRDAPANLVVALAGPMLLGRAPKFDLTIRLDMSESALRRHTPPDARWTIPALLCHNIENPDTPTLFVRWDHPDRPALRDAGPS